MDKESLRLLLAHGLTISQIAQRFGKAPSTVAYWMETHVSRITRTPQM